MNKCIIDTTEASFLFKMYLQLSSVLSTLYVLLQCESDSGSCELTDSCTENQQHFLVITYSKVDFILIVKRLFAFSLYYKKNVDLTKSVRMSTLSCCICIYKQLKGFL